MTHIGENRGPRIGPCGTEVYVSDVVTGGDLNLDYTL